jgi:heme-degrading monooxygenase HmoA
MSIKVLIKRTIPQGKARDMLNLFMEMRSLASGQDGYISGETLKSSDRPDVFLVISTWATDDDWENWLKNKDRQKIQGKIDDLLGGNTSYEIFHYGLRES